MQPLDMSYQVFNMISKFSHFRHWNEISHICGISSIDNVERTHLGCLFFRLTVGKLHMCQLIISSFRLPSPQSFKYVGQTPIYHFSLAICLWMMYWSIVQHAASSPKFVKDAWQIYIILSNAFLNFTKFHGIQKYNMAIFEASQVFLVGTKWAIYIYPSTMTDGVFTSMGSQYQSLNEIHLISYNEARCTGNGIMQPSILCTPWTFEKLYLEIFGNIGMQLCQYYCLHQIVLKIMIALYIAKGIQLN